MPMKKRVGRPKTRTDRQIIIQKLYDKLVRNVYAVVEYDMYLHNIPKLRLEEAKKLVSACSAAINELKHT